LFYRVVADEGDFLVIDKSPGSNLHRNDQERSLLDVLKADFGGIPLYLVHRLDDATSGLLLLAKTSSVAATLSGLFAQREIGKYYLALAEGKPKKKQGSVIGDMEKSRNGSYRLRLTRTNPAVTQFFSVSAGAGRRLYLLRPRTGKTHQLRVVLKSLGVPILGDARYRGAAADRCYLHAYALVFEYCGKRYQYCCPPTQGEHFLTDEVGAALLNWTQPWQLNWPGTKAVEGEQN
jgi:tRNA pseudouridine32 synthase / 23S rRNA pseudouridine746 synthase